jgi:GT2 family glycosyltransferase
MSFPKVAIVILSWNGRKYLEQFLPSVCMTSYSNLEIVVADNNSTDDSADFITKHYPSISYLQLEKNYGFAAGYNEAIKKVEAEYIILLNQDVETPSNDWITPLITMMQHDSLIAVVQPKIKFLKNKNQFEYAGASGGFLDRYYYPFCRGRIMSNCEIDQNQYDSDIEIAWASGACMLIRKSLYESVGGLDADLFAHMEEIDLCLRLKNIGYKIFICSKSEVYHLGGGSLPQGSSRKVFLNFRNNLAIIVKNYNQGSVVSILLVRFILDLIAAMQFAAKLQFKQSYAVIRAIFSFYITYSEWNSKRKNLMTNWNNSNRNGFYSKSVLIDYYLLGKRKYSELRK